MSRLLLSLGVLLILPVTLAAELRFAAGIDNQPWQQILYTYVDEKGNVDYDRLRQSAADRQLLQDYLADFAKVPGEKVATGNEYRAQLINLYNALTINEVLRLQPKKSFWDHKPFDLKIHTVGGKKVSLNDVEHKAARPAMGYRVHAVLVCAARSCPPLPRDVFTAANVNRLLDERMQLWLADTTLNRYDAKTVTVEVSKIFEWFAADFTAAGGLATVLARHGPEELRGLFTSAALKIGYLDYDTSLNKQ